MFADFPRRLTMSLVLVAGSCAALFPVLHTSKAWAEDDEDEDEDGGDDEGGDDEGGDEEEEEEDEDQPPITAGGLYTLQTYPQGEVQRPLTMTMGLTELRAGVGFDISNKTAFETFGAELYGRYGLQDHVELQAGFKGTNNFKNFAAYAAFEGAIVYDLVDFRAGLQVAHVPGKTEFGVSLGFPFRYAVKPQLAITALETAFEIQFDSKPDATPNVGVVIQPAPIVAILVKAAVRVTDFDFSEASKLAIPGTIAVQLSPSNKLDVGMDFTFNNLKPADESVKFYDDRFLLFFAQLRL